MTMKKKIREPIVDYPPPPHLVRERFIYATGLRYSEMVDLRANDVHQEPDGRVWLEIAGWADTPTRKVPVRAGYEQEILALVKNPYVFGGSRWYPMHWGRQSLRHAYVRQPYQQLRKAHAGEASPSAPGDVDEAALSGIMQALCYQRRDVVLCAPTCASRSQHQTVPRNRRPC